MKVIVDELLVYWMVKGKNYPGSYLNAYKNCTKDCTLRSSLGIEATLAVCSGSEVMEPE